MEMSYEQYRLVKKALRRRFSTVGWILLIYYGIMNVCVMAASLVQTVVEIINSMMAGKMPTLDALSAQSAWGYFLAAAIGLGVLLIWKKPRFWKTEIWARGKAMTSGSFLALLCVFLSGQLVYQLLMTVTEAILNAVGLSVVAGMEAVAMDTSHFGMFLYGGILAPITEELLFRGLIQRMLLPYGKRFAILASAFTFGIFHGNLLQTPYAFLVGLVLGYAACEYSIAWAMVLHMINNLVLGDMLTRLTSGLPEVGAALVIWCVLLLSAVGAMVALILRRKEAGSYRRENPLNKTCTGCFFSSPGVIVLMAVMGLNMILTVFVMVTPL